MFKNSQTGYFEKLNCLNGGLSNDASGGKFTLTLSLRTQAFIALIKYAINNKY